ncbi:hypothetical protein DASC09_058110 [Saccharomycopsis crataegensis]|uniref:HPP transmembrane region domain-containing protein n=1 Tax=Saccharomycopsis crataegensis TaxID=43959 RepID=A0AAV5QU79_9ASCO|nr:hypothetical protein DASC09_058110 [Saccharomycopsis crataegensis]
MKPLDDVDRTANNMAFKFTIDKLLNRHIVPSVVPSLPQPFRRLLGGNRPNFAKIHDYWIWLDIFLGSFCGIALIEGVFKSPNVFTDYHGAPMIIASYGATAILCFNTIHAPLAQPRNILFGHFISSLIGVCISKLFSLSSNGRDNYWAAGALSVGLSSVVMTILNCVHPPAGASALLACIDESIRKMSWWYLPTQIVSSLLIICVSLIFNNVIRFYPLYWWTAADLKPKQQKQDLESDHHVPEVEEKKSSSSLEDLNIENKFQLFETSSEITGVEINGNGIKLPTANGLSNSDIEALQSIYYKLFKLDSKGPVAL